VEREIKQKKTKQMDIEISSTLSKIEHDATVLLNCFAASTAAQSLIQKDQTLLREKVEGLVEHQQKTTELIEMRCDDNYISHIVAFLSFYKYFFLLRPTEKAFLLPKQEYVKGQSEF